MSAKDVHVKSYTRDGEKVREHWRSHPDTGIDDVVSSAVKQAVLRGGVEHTDISLDSIVDVIRDIANKGKDAWNKIPKPIKTVLAQALIQSVLYNPSSAANAKVVSGGQASQNVSTNNNIHGNTREENRSSFSQKLQELSSIKEKLQDNLSQENIYNKTKKVLSDREVYNKVKDIINRHPYISKYTLYAIAGSATSDNFKNLGLKHSGEILKASLDFDNAAKINDTYIAKNYKELEPLSEFIKEKLESQKFNPENTPGIVYGVNSDISKDIANSQSIKNYIRDNWNSIKNGQPINKKLKNYADKRDSITLNSTLNLYSAINHADVLSAFLSRNEKDIIMVILDTYDFNPNENILAELGHSAQNAGILYPFFNIFVVRIPVDI